MLCQQTSPKRWFGKIYTTSNCDVTNSAHQIKMTTICHWMKNPMKIFSVRHCQKHINAINVWEWATFSTMKKVKSETSIECQAKHCQVSGLLPQTYWYWYRNDSVREASTTGIALICNKFLLLLCNNFDDTLTSLTYFPFCILSICFL